MYQDLLQMQLWPEMASCAICQKKVGLSKSRTWKTLNICWVFLVFPLYSMNHPNRPETSKQSPKTRLVFARAAGKAKAHNPTMPFRTFQPFWDWKTTLEIFQDYTPYRPQTVEEINRTWNLKSCLNLLLCRCKTIWKTRWRTSPRRQTQHPRPTGRQDEASPERQTQHPRTRGGHMKEALRTPKVNCSRKKVAQHRSYIHSQKDPHKSKELFQGIKTIHKYQHEKTIQYQMSPNNPSCRDDGHEWAEDTIICIQHRHWQGSL